MSVVDEIRRFLIEQSIKEFGPLREPIEVVVISAMVGEHLMTSGFLITAAYNGDHDELQILYTDEERIDGESGVHPYTAEYLDRETTLALIRVAEKTWPGISAEASS